MYAEVAESFIGNNRKKLFIVKYVYRKHEEISEDIRRKE